MKILLIEDDEILVAHLSDALRQQNYTVEAISEGRLGLEYVQATRYDLIILDVELPDFDGISLCRELRQQQYQGAILLLTAKGGSTDKIRGLDAGADDYVVKPCTSEEISARIRALLRRPREMVAAVLQWGNLRLDPTTCQVYYTDRALALSPKEYSLLELFLRHPQQLFKSDVLLERLWSFEETPGEETVRTHIKRLRRKLKQAGADDVIENVYGMGYRLVSPPKGSPAAEGKAAAATHQPKSSTSNRSAVSDETLEIASQTLSSAQAEARSAAKAALKQFGPLLAERLAILDNAIAALKTDTLSTNLQQRSRQAAHKLSGALGMFGLVEGSQRSQEIETILATESEPDAQSLLLALQPLVNRLHQILDAALTTAASADIDAEDDLTSQATPMTPSSWVLLAVQEDPERVAELTIAAQDILSNLLITSHTQARHQIATQKPDGVLVDMAAFPTWETGLKFLQDLAINQPNLPKLVLATSDNFQARLDITRCCPLSVYLSPATTTLQILEQAIAQFCQRSPSRHHVLAIDDDPAILSTLSQQLSDHGFQMTALEDPSQLWEVLSLIQPDLLLMDFDMPEVNGIELCRVIRSDRRWQRLPIVFLSNSQDPQIIQQIYQSGADDYIAKLSIKTELITRIMSRINRYREL